MWEASEGEFAFGTLVEDLDSDGYEDVVVGDSVFSSSVQTDLVVFAGSPVPANASADEGAGRVETAAYPIQLLSGDIDVDGHSDLVVYDPGFQSGATLLYGLGDFDFVESSHIETYSFCNMHGADVGSRSGERAWISLGCFDYNDQAYLFTSWGG